MRFRSFNIKILLIAIALIAGLLALARARYLPLWQVHQLKQWGANTMYFDHHGNLTILDMDTTRHLPEITNWIDCTHVTNLCLGHEFDNSIALINKFPRLQYLHLDMSYFDDATAVHIKGLRLEYVGLTSTDVTRKGVETLLKSNQIDKIDAMYTAITEQDAKELSKKYSVKIEYGIIPPDPPS
ncbi:hypothetical protein GC197_03220 [bacterium]|nr:hypothetical protein [bacterium]